MTTPIEAETICGDLQNNAEVQRSDSTPDPDVLWSPDGIDALIWADIEPFADTVSPSQLDPIESVPDEQALWLGRS